MPPRTISQHSDRGRKILLIAYVAPPVDKENIKPENLMAREKKRAKEPDVIKDWRKRMANEEGEAVMQRRGRIERVNAQAKNRGLGTMLVRGLAKVHMRCAVARAGPQSGHGPQAAR